MATNFTDKIKDVPDNPYQPVNISFPSRTFGVSKLVNRAFQQSWFKKFTWLHYDVTSDSAFCFACCKAFKQGKLRCTGLTEHSFLINGFVNWKDATRAFTKHEASNFHKQAVDSLVVKSTVGELLSSQHAKEKKDHRDYLVQDLSAIRYLARQGLPLRGDKEEIDSNLHQLFRLLAVANPTISSMLETKRSKFTSPEIQNELICIANGTTNA